MVGSIYKKAFKPSAVAIKYKDESISYEQLDKTVCQTANFLKAFGVNREDRVVLSCPNSPQFIYAYLGVVKNSAIIVPINRQLTMEETKYVVQDCEAKFIMIDEETFKKVGQTLENVEAQLGVKVIVMDEDFKRAVGEMDSLGYESEDQDAIKNYNAEETLTDSKISTFLYTSGTTGKQKAAMLSHKNLVTNAEQSRLAFHGTSSDNYLCVLPMHHVFAFTTCVLNPLLAGSTITILEKFHPKEVISALTHGGITVFTGVPTMYVVLLEACKDNVTFPNLRLAISGGAALPVEVLRQAKSILKLPVVEGYGLTESSPVVCFNPLDGVQKEGSIGLPISGVACKIVDEHDQEVAQGEVGEIIVRGDNIMLGYFKQEEETRKALKDGWLHTGDLGKKDEDGYVFIVDRKKDLVIVGGVNVYPREIEEVLYQHPKVKEAAVIGIEDHLRGEKVKAFVVLKEEETCSAKEITTYLKQHIAAYKVPRDVAFISELPKNSTGKILKRMLKESV